eukprot:jgi/Bigna1/90992/estExt_fgenesh1_pg.C_850052
MEEEGSKKRVLIVGGGVAGLSCAWSLSRKASKFDIELWDGAEGPGGVATSEKILGDAGGVVINDGVQGAPPTYHNLLKIHRMLGYEPFPIEMRISFGRGEKAWCNYEARPIQEKFSKEIRRFGKVLKWVYWLTPIFIAVPIDTLLRFAGFSPEFGSAMVYPLVALFFGTGNQTPNVPAALIARVFLDPELRIFEYDPKWLLSQTPRFYAFRELKDIYRAFEKRIISESGGKTVFASDGKNPEKEFDAVVFACSAENILCMLLAGAENPGKTFWDREEGRPCKRLMYHRVAEVGILVLGNVRYYDDVTYTHTDEDYMRRHYHLGMGERPAPYERLSALLTRAYGWVCIYDSVGDKGEQYFIHNYDEDPKRIEMSFDLSCYQPMLAEKKEEGGGTRKGTETKKAASTTPEHEEEKKQEPVGTQQHQQQDGAPPRVFQSIYLDQKGCEKHWTRNGLDSKKVHLVKWWRQFAHTWTHFLFTVPLLRFIQGGGHDNCFFAGAYTLFNTHELAAVSGLAAAERLGASYPFYGDGTCTKTLNM